MKHKGHKYLWAILTVTLISIVISYLLRDTIGFLGSREGLGDFLREFGIWAPLAVILFIILEAVVAPLPGGVMPIVAGFLFGPLLGILYAWIGNVLGSSLAFGISRRWGKRVIRYFAPSFDQEHYGEVMREHHKLFWLLYAVPIVPVDVLSFALGASAMTYRRFVSTIAGAFLLRMAFWVLLGGAISNLLFF